MDVVAEMLANVNLDKDLKLLAEGGRVAIIGNRGKIEIDPRYLLQIGSKPNLIFCQGI